METISNEAIVTHILQVVPDVSAIYRSGSAGLIERSDSDIDLAILVSNPGRTGTSGVGAEFGDIVNKKQRIWRICSGPRRCCATKS